MTIDPDISGIDTDRDMWARANDSVDHASDYRLVSGRYNTSFNTSAAMSYVEFDNTEILGRDIVSATASLWQYSAATCANKRMMVNPIASKWLVHDGWANRPSVLSTETTYVDANHGGGSACADAWVHLNVTEMAKKWANETYPNYGIRLSSTGGSDATYDRRFCSRNPDTSSACNTATHRPYLSLTYELETPDDPYVADDVVSQDIDPQVAPNPEPQTLLETVPGNAEFDFTPQVNGAYALSASTGGRVSLQRDSVDLGEFTPHAIDAAGVALATTLLPSGSSLHQQVTTTSSTTFPVVVIPSFKASDPTLGAVQAIYPAAIELPDPNATPADPVDPNATPADPVIAVDEAMEEYIAALLDPESELEGAGEATVDDTATSSFTSAAAARTYIPVPKKKTSNGRWIYPKYYHYDADGNDPVYQPWPKAWHDYCTKSPDNYGGASFKGPCARHDLCIEYKQATDRKFCDSHLQWSLKINCKYRYHQNTKYDKDMLSRCKKRADTYYSYVKKATNGNKDKGHWGHHGHSWWPSYQYNIW